MCRFLAYKGQGVFLSDLITKSDQSLIHQSFRAREREEPLNGDGFGVGWYAPEVGLDPCVFTSITPAWSNRNLHRLAEKIQSPCVFAHVRAATPGSLVSETNCHPFQSGRFLWMHNGSVDGFAHIRRRLRSSLSDESEALIQGTTDTEHMFGVFLDKLAARGSEVTGESLAGAVADTILQVAAWTRESGRSTGATCNLAVTDGQHVVVSRHSSHAHRPAETLYIAQGERFESAAGSYRMRPADGTPRAIIVASEPLTSDRSDWQPIPDRHVVSITPDMQVRMTPVA